MQIEADDESPRKLFFGLEIYWELISNASPLSNEIVKMALDDFKYL